MMTSSSSIAPSPVRFVVVLMIAPSFNWSAGKSACRETQLAVALGPRSLNLAIDSWFRGDDALYESAWLVTE
jgi:hypothetical protein